MSVFHCPECGFVFDEAKGVPREGFPPGTPFAQVPDDWTCPDCGVRDKLDFVAGSPEAPSPGAAERP
ncbi:MAG: rubredoxin [Solirubrobacteraceae bacterium]